MRLSALCLALFVVACGSEQGGTVGVTQSDDGQFMCNGMDAREVVTSIRQHGAVLSNEREGVFYFYGPANVLGDLESGLKALGFAVRPTNTEPGRIATINAVIDEAWLAKMIPQICKLSSDLGVEYDGWEASIPEAAGRR